MENQPPRKQGTKLPNHPKFMRPKTTTASHDLTITNNNPKENTTNRKENVQQKTSMQQPSATPTTRNDPPKTPKVELHLITETQPIPEPTNIRNTTNTHNRTTR